VDRNVEIKARIVSIGAMHPIAAALADGGPTPIAQDDTFFACDAGRLKLRDGEAAEAGVAEARALMARLGVEPSALVEGAYVDLLAARGGRGG
jgi:adenylate cyclase class IV